MECFVALAAIVIVLLIFAVVAADKDLESRCNNDCCQGRRCDCNGLRNCESGLTEADVRRKFESDCG